MSITLRSAALVGAAALVLAACGTAPEDEAEETSAATETEDAGAEQVDFQACMVSDAGGIDDRSFNASAWNSYFSCSYSSFSSICSSSQT